MTQSAALGHLGLMLGILGLILAISPLPSASPLPGYLPWLIGLILVIGEYFGVERSQTP